MLRLHECVTRSPGLDETWFTKTRIWRWLGGGFAVFCIFAILMTAGPIAREATRRAAENLKIAGFDWADVERHGRGIAVKGIAPSAEEGQRAVEIAKADWAVRDAWGEYTIQPPQPPTAAPEAPAKEGALQPSGPAIVDARVCQSLLDALMSDGVIAFASGEADLAPESLAVLDALAGGLLRCETVWIDVSGRAPRGMPPAAGLAISQARAEAVVVYLTGRGVPFERIAATGRSVEPGEMQATPEIAVRVMTRGDAE